MISIFTSPFGGGSRGRINVSLETIMISSGLERILPHTAEGSIVDNPPPKGETKRSYFLIFLQKVILILILSIYNLTPTLFSQTFPPAAGLVGSTAIKMDSSIILAWANRIVVERGFMNIANPIVGIASFGVETNGIGVAEGNSNDVVSLGDSGIAILTFERAIKNESGPDFAVFENGFANDYIELAFVEVSSDGINYFRFPSISEAPILVQIGPFEYSDCRYFNNLAGKYRQGFGTPFDLEELAGIFGLDIYAITHVKLIDVIGAINPLFGSQDSQGHLINDLYPTEFVSGGFDLDGVAVIHQAPLSVEELELNVSIYPNPTSCFITINIPNESLIRIIDITGKVLLEDTVINSKSLDLSHYNSTVLFVEISNSSFNRVEKIFVRH